jgi:hypothetical protein
MRGRFCPAVAGRAYARILDWGEIAHVTAFPGRAHARKGREAPTPVGVEKQKVNRG